MLDRHSALNGEIMRPSYAPLASHGPSVLSECDDFSQFLKLPLNFYIVFKMYV